MLVFWLLSMIFVTFNEAHRAHRKIFAASSKSFCDEHRAGRCTRALLVLMEMQSLTVQPSNRETHNQHSDNG